MIFLTEQLQKTLFSNKKIAIKQKIISKKKQVFKTYTQEQEFLLPKNLNDFVAPGHIARLVSTIINRMDTSFITDTYKGGGTSAYDPKMLLKSWILAFTNKVYSSRMLAKNLRENLPFIWISGNQTPDFHTLNNFRLRLKNDIKKIFKQIVLYALEKGIIESKDVFVDHTKREANANKHKVIWKKQVEKQLAKIDQELDALFEYADKVNEEEDKIFVGKDLPEQERQKFDEEKVKEVIDKINNQIKNKEKSREKGKEQKEKIRRLKILQERKDSYEEKKEILSGRNSFSKTDHDAVAMMMKDKITIKPAYNEGIAVEHGFVLNYVISQNCGDAVSFIPLMEGVIDNLEKTPENTNSDGAYGSEENMAFLEQRGIHNYLKYNHFQKEKSKKWNETKFHFKDFIYNQEKDELTCKNGAVLKLEKVFSEKTTHGFIRQIKRYCTELGKCSTCSFREKCTNAKEARTIQVTWEGERLKKQAKINLESEKGKELRKRRGNEVESVFGDQKLNKDKKRYNLRGLFKVNLEAGLYYIAHNLRKIHTWKHPTSQKGLLSEKNNIQQCSFC